MRTLRCAGMCRGMTYALLLDGGEQRTGAPGGRGERRPTGMLDPFALGVETDCTGGRRRTPVATRSGPIKWWGEPETARLACGDDA